MNLSPSFSNDALGQSLKQKLLDAVKERATQGEHFEELARTFTDDVVREMTSHIKAWQDDTSILPDPFQEGDTGKLYLSISQGDSS